MPLPSPTPRSSRCSRRASRNPPAVSSPTTTSSTGELEDEEAWRILIAYWSAVRDTFPDAWGKPPSQSRLMHGTGIRAMGRLMDRMMASFHPREANLRSHLRDELRTVAPVCRWTSGRWEELDLEWQEVQNVPRHLGLLSSFSSAPTSAGGEVP